MTEKKSGISHPAGMTSQERLRYADALLRDDLTKEQREAANAIIYHLEAKLTLVRAAVDVTLAAR